MGRVLEENEIDGRHEIQRFMALLEARPGKAPETLRQIHMPAYRHTAQPLSWLHAAKVEFRHPVTDALTRIEAPLPAALASFLASQSAGRW